MKPLTLWVMVRNGSDQRFILNNLPWATRAECREEVKYFNGDDHGTKKAKYRVAKFQEVK